MRKIIVFLFTCFYLCSNLCAQSTRVPQDIASQTDEALVRIFYAAEKKDSVAVENIITEIDRLTGPYADAYPIFTGLIQMHLSYYAWQPQQRTDYMNKGLHLLKDTDSTLAEEFSSTFLWLLQSFAADNRAREWKAADKLYRLALNKNKDSRQLSFAILNYANDALRKNNYTLVSNLAKYESAAIKEYGQNSTIDKCNKIFSDWLQLSQQFEQWKKLSYSEQTGNTYYMNEGQEIPDFLKGKTDSALVYFDYNNAFKKLLDNIFNLRKEFITNNHRADAQYESFKRSNYFFFANTVLFGYFDWAKLSQNESKPLLDLKVYLWEDVADEIADAKKHNQVPVMPATSLANAYNSLSMLYAATGNADQALQALYEGVNQINRNSIFSTDEKKALFNFYPQFITAHRLTENYEKALEANRLWLSLMNNPDSINENTLAQTDQYFNARIEQVFTLMAMNKNKEATDTTIAIIDAYSALAANNESLVYKTTSWVKLQYLTATISAQNGKWNTQLIKEMISDLMQNRTHLNILYPAHLLMLKAEWKTRQTVNEDYLANLLRYTGNQLFTNFAMLTAPERMQYFSAMLQEYFDVYHELLFSGALDSFPALRRQVSQQSMYLKNSLSDGNLIPDDLFASYAKKNPAFLQRLRTLRQEVILKNDKNRLYKNETDNTQFLNDQFQKLWLSALKENTQASTNFSPQQMADSLLGDQSVYIESVRYRQWLTDSGYRYGAYIIQKNKTLQLVSLCSEKDLLAIINNPAASPQNAGMATNAARGTELIGKKNTTGKRWKAGDKDLLASLLIQPLQKYLHAREWILVNDGLLNRIAFSALLYNDKFLTEQVMLRQLSSIAQLKKSTALPKKNNILLAGDINYGNSFETNSNSLLQNKLQWNYLPGTRKEINALQQQMQKSGYKTTLLTGNALQDSLYTKLGTYNIVHLATHGFYMSAEQASQNYNPAFSTDAVMAEPLFRCGLAVSDANHPLNMGETTPGYIMGYELANTDLRNCYLISLSACETGLGDIRNNMGVDGLSRALKIGGAKNLLISLWNVPDEPTAIFMQHFYEALFKTGSPSAALRQTQLKMCRQYNATDWGAFILVE